MRAAFNGSEVLRTDDERFARLPGFPFAPNYIDPLPGFEGLRLHYLDENAAGRFTFLCLHGEPTWSYLYRRMIPVFAAAGHRVVAPDFFGFGRSDKPADDAVYTFAFHRETLFAFIAALDLTNIVLVCQDWGGILGLTLPMDMPERCAGLFVMDTLIGTGEGLPKAFFDWRTYVQRTPDINVARLLKRACPHLSEDEAAAYDAPFPDARFKAGVRQFPNLVPDRADAPGAEISRKAEAWLKESWDGKSVVAIGMKDPVLSPATTEHIAGVIQGCPPPIEVTEAGHFVQEWSDEFTARALEVLDLPADGP
ncbi:MAG: haloalkane dehalogenase [Rhodospirillaceae bacterium]